MRLALLSAVVVATLSVGCAAEPETDGDSAASAVKGGQAAPAALGRSVVQVYTEQTDPRGNEVDKYCTGVLVGPRAVLTSLECFATRTWAWSDKGPYKLARGVVGTGDTSATRLIFKPTNIASMSPVFSTAAEKAKTHDDLIATSLALLTLTEDLAGGVPLAVGNVPTERDKVTVAGYGCDASADSWGTLRTLSMTWNAWNGWWSKDFTCTKAPGDHGAAVLDASGRLVGVATGIDAVLPLTPEVRAQLPR